VKYQIKQPESKFSQMRITNLIIIVLLVQLSLYAEDSTLIKLQHDEQYFGNKSILVLFDDGSKSNQVDNIITDSMKINMENSPIISFGPVDIYEVPNFSQHTDTTWRWEDYIDKIKMNNHMRRAAQVNQIPEIENLFHDIFYQHRQITSGKYYLLEPGYKNHMNNQNNSIPKIAELNNFNSYNTAQLKIVNLQRQGTEDIHFLFKPVVLKILTASEYLFLEHFLYYFFKTNLVQSNNKFRIQFSPIERLSKIEIPEYLPLVSIQTHSNYSEKIIMQWPQIYRVLINFLQVKNLQVARNELKDHILYELSSIFPRLVFSSKIALHTGYWIQLDTFEEELNQIDLEAFNLKIEKIFLQQLFYIFWIINEDFDEKIMENIDSSIKFEIITF